MLIKTFKLTCSWRYLAFLLIKLKYLNQARLFETLTNNK